MEVKFKSIRTMMQIIKIKDKKPISELYGSNTLETYECFGEFINRKSLKNFEFPYKNFTILKLSFILIGKSYPGNYVNFYIPEIDKFDSLEYREELRYFVKKNEKI